MQLMEVRTRIAPSPTGIPHIGNTRTVLFNYLFVKKNNGKFIVRLEDTDRERYVPESVPKILEILQWLGIGYDEGPYVQSERLTIYKKYAEELVDKGAAYYCFCNAERLEQVKKKQEEKHEPPRYDRYCLGHITTEEAKKKIDSGEKFVIRLRVPDDGETGWKDLVRGEITVKNKEIDDQILLKSDGFPTYHLGVVVDDYLMKISHVLRGAEWISSTPKHILLYKAFGWELPEFGHLPLVLGPDRAKLSKRHGAKSALDYRDEGYLPEAILNTIFFWGFSPKSDKQFYSLEEMIKIFDLSGVQPSDAIVDLNKLDFFNGYYIRQKSGQELAELMNKKDVDLRIIDLVKDRMKKLTDFDSLTNYFYNVPQFDLSLMPKTINSEQRKKIIEGFVNNLTIFEECGRKMAAEMNLKVGDVFMVPRVAITGSIATPPLCDIIKILGMEETILRLRSGLT